ncbi:MAG: hypothetical protein J6X33_00280 [Clostridiales bacterium]|nr:hypothetical protein [Clostridiales bacterium]
MRSGKLKVTAVILSAAILCGVAGCTPEPKENPFPDAAASMTEITEADHIHVKIVAEPQDEGKVKATFTNNTEDKKLFYDGRVGIDYRYGGEWYNVYSKATEAVLDPDMPGIGPSRSSSVTVDLKKELGENPPRGHYRVTKSVQFAPDAGNVYTIAAEFDIK